LNSEKPVSPYEDIFDIHEIGSRNISFLIAMVDPELKAFVEAEIIPQYKNFGHSHGVEHVTRVIANSMELARFIMPSQALDMNMVYAIAAYHDLGMSGPREIHHITSGRILIEDARLSRWFTRGAVADHERGQLRTTERLPTMSRGASMAG
jgi:hypothetical protein